MIGDDTGVVPRISERRTPARPATDDQENRRGAILSAAARLGATKEIDRIGAQEIAAEAGVALRTLRTHVLGLGSVRGGHRHGSRGRAPELLPSSSCSEMASFAKAGWVAFR